MSGESNVAAEWTCPLCQRGQADRSSLSSHLTEQHSVLPTCVDKLLDIVRIAGAALLKLCCQYVQFIISVFGIVELNIF